MLKKPFKFAVVGLAAAAAFSMTSLALAADATPDDTSAQVSASASDDPFATENAAPVAGPAASAEKSGFLHRGFYALAQVDYGFSKWKEFDQDFDGHFSSGSKITKATEINTSRGLGGRAAVGYDINPFFGVEIGGFINPAINKKLKVTELSSSREDIKPATKDQEEDFSKTSSYGADLVGKVHMAFGSLFGFAGAGMAWTHYKSSISDPNGWVTDGASPPKPVAGTSVTWNHFSPEVLGGLGYAINDNMAVTAQYTYLFGKAVGDKADPTDFGSDGKPKFGYGFSKISLGFTYKF